MGRLVKHNSDASKGGCTYVLPIVHYAAESLKKRSRSRRSKTRAMGPESDTVYIGHLKTKKTSGTAA